MVIALSVSVSCSDDDNGDGGVNALIGTWGLEEMDEGVEVSLKATFNEDLSGNINVVLSFMGETETENSSFTWSTNGNKLTMNIDGEDTETSTYSISGDKLTITDDDGSKTVLTRL